MSGFPLMWEDDVLGPPDHDGCPVGVQAIEQYLKSCAYYHLTDDPPRKFGPLSLVIHKVIDGREFWIWRCEDSVGEGWYVVASDGRGSPRRWVFAETDDGRTAEEFLKGTLHEYGQARDMPY